MITTTYQSKIYLLARIVHTQIYCLTFFKFALKWAYNAHAIHFWLVLLYYVVISVNHAHFFFLLISWP